MQTVGGQYEKTYRDSVIRSNEDRKETAEDWKTVNTYSLADAGASCESLKAETDCDLSISNRWGD